MITSMGLYALLVLVVYGASLAQAGSELDIQQMAGGLLWVVVLFTSLLGLNRSFSHEKENGCLESILLVPMDRSVIFLAKATANLVFLLIVEVICVPLFFFFFLGTVGAAESWPLMFAPLLVGTIGIAGIRDAAFNHYHQYARQRRYARGVVHSAYVPTSVAVRFSDHGRAGWRRGSEGDVHHVNGFGGGLRRHHDFGVVVLYDFVVSA